MLAFLLNLVIRFLLFILCRINWKEYKKVPRSGPMILVGNHINFLDAPVAFTYLYPRKITSLVKRETFENPILNFLFKTWGSIPVARGTADFDARGKALDVLRAGEFFIIAPEGTRTNNGQLIQGQPGILIIAMKSGAPVLPVVQYGMEEFRNNIKHLRRTRVAIRVGEPFVVSPSSAYPSKEERQQITDEIMYQMAMLLPEKYRGYYADLEKATTNFLNFDVPKGELYQPLGKKIAQTITKIFTPSKNPAV